VSSAYTNSVFRKALAPPPDYYKVTLTAGQTVTFSTSTPGDGEGQPGNQLDPHLELYNGSQTLVAAGGLLPDGRNEAITYTAPVSGTYYVKVSGENLTEGDYVLDPVETGGDQGSSGNDLPMAGNGRDVLISETGTERMVGAAGDILISGQTVFDDQAA